MSPTCTGFFASLRDRVICVASDRSAFGQYAFDRTDASRCSKQLNITSRGNRAKCAHNTFGV